MSDLKTILDWIRYSTSQLSDAHVYYGHGCETPLDEAAALVLGVLKLPYNIDSQYFNARLTEDECALIAESLRRRIQDRVPVPYISHRTLFMGLEFYIDERALIPRSPLAELIDGKFEPWWSQESEPQSILDLCCGSGCLGLACKYQFPDSDILLADIDEDALDVAEINIEGFGLDESDEVLVVQSDLFDNIAESFDIIICNPPYVEREEQDFLPEEYLHEPQQALIAGDDGMDIVSRVLQEAADYLNPNGLLIMEVGMSWPILEDCYPEIDFNWVELHNGGEGVLVQTREELLAWRADGLF